MKDQQKSELLKGLLEAVGEIEFEYNEYQMAKSDVLKQVRTRLEAWVKGLSFELDEGELSNIVLEHCTKFFKEGEPTLSQDIASKGASLVRMVKK